MRWAGNRRSPADPRHLFGPLLVCLLVGWVLTGCAVKPWTASLEGVEAESAGHLVDSLAARDKACGPTLEGDLVLFYQDPLGRKALSGFLQFSLPAAYKFVMANPFGQPILVITGDQQSFQAINTLEQQYLAGSLRAYGLRHRIPEYFLKSNWGAILTGRNLSSSRTIVDVREDRQNRGIWVTLQEKDQPGLTHLLLDPQQEVFLARVLENDQQKTVAEITYADWLNLGLCKQPQEIHVTGLDYGTDISIKLSNIELSEAPRTYRLRPPAGYRRQYMP